MAGLSFIWTLRYRGWAVCTISDDHSQAEAIASDITGGPEYLLRAVKSVTQGADRYAEFEAEPTAFRRFFQRCGSDVKIRLAKAPDRNSSDSEDIVIWSGCYTIDALARAVLNGFDNAVSELGEENYRSNGAGRSHVKMLRHCGPHGVRSLREPSMAVAVGDG